MKKNFLFVALTAITSMTMLSACFDSDSPDNQASPTSADPTQVTPQPVAETPVGVDSVATDSAATLPDPATQGPVQGDTGTTVPPVTSDSLPPTVETTGCAEGVVPVPVTYPQDEFIDVGDVLKIDTRTGEYMARVKEE